MKKFVALLCALLITLSLAACNNSTEASTPSETPSVSKQESIPEPDEPELSEYELWKDSILIHINEAYTGKTDAGASMYFCGARRTNSRFWCW